MPLPHALSGLKLTRTQPNVTLENREVLKGQATHYYQTFQNILLAASSLVVNGRSHEYGPPANNFLHGDESYLQTLWLKVSRLINLVEVKRNVLAQDGWEAYARFDRGRLVDSLVDLINYTAFWATDVYLAGAWPENAPPVVAPAEVEAGWSGREVMQCPLCNNPKSGFFGRQAGKWYIGCVDCDFTRHSPAVGGLFNYYAESGNARKFRRYDQTANPGHVTRKTPINTVPRGTVDGIVPDLALQTDPDNRWIGPDGNPVDPAVLGATAQPEPELSLEELQQSLERVQEMQREVLTQDLETLAAEAPAEVAAEPVLEETPPVEEPVLEPLPELPQDPPPQSEIPGASPCPCLSGLSYENCHKPKMEGVLRCSNCAGKLKLTEVGKPPNLERTRATCSGCNFNRIYASEEVAVETLTKAYTDTKASGAAGEKLTAFERAEILNEMENTNRDS